MFFPYHIMKYFEKMIASDKSYWNNCTVLQQNTQVILHMNVAQLLKHFLKCN